MASRPGAPLRPDRLVRERRSPQKLDRKPIVISSDAPCRCPVCFVYVIIKKIEDGTPTRGVATAKVRKKGWYGFRRANPFCQGEEEEKEVMLCFQVKLPVKQAIQVAGMLLQRLHECVGLCLFQVAIFNGIVNGALDGVQNYSAQME